MAQALGRVVDSSALDACAESRGRHTIEIPTAWIGAEIVVAVPARIMCARCDGGGCDGCNRRGGHRLDGDEQARTLRIKLPRAMTSTVVLRLARPFGHAEGSLAQLYIETRIGSVASSGVVLCALASREVEPGAKGTNGNPKPHIFKKGRSRNRSPAPPSKSPHVTWVVAAFFALGILAAVATMR